MENKVLKIIKSRVSCRAYSEKKASLKKAFDVFGANVVGVDGMAMVDAPQEDAPIPDDGADIYGDGAIPLPEDSDVPLPTEEDE